MSISGSSNSSDIPDIYNNEPGRLGEPPKPKPDIGIFSQPPHQVERSLGTMSDEQKIDFLLKMADVGFDETLNAITNDRNKELVLEMTFPNADSTILHTFTLGTPIDRQEMLLNQLEKQFNTFTGTQKGQFLASKHRYQEQNKARETETPNVSSTATASIRPDVRTRIALAVGNATIGRMGFKLTIGPDGKIHFG